MTADDPSTPTRTGSQSVARALAVLDCFAAADGDLGVSDVAARTGLTTSTAHRLIRALLDAGFLGQDERTERYHLGSLLVAMGRRAEAHLGFDRLLPDLQALSARTGESVNLGTRVGHEVLIVLHVPSSQPLRFDQPVGSRVAVHASAMGKAMLAYATDPAAEVAGLGDLSGFTGATITTPAALIEDLAATRRRGWSINDGERDPGVRTIGAPLLGSDGRPFAAIAVQGPAVRMTDDLVAELAEDLCATAEVLSGTRP
jgi:IclR family transcriptional regulator, acetate operon repressor